MEFQYSRLVDPSYYQLDGFDGLCDGVFLREHIDSIIGDIGAVRAQEDWQKLVSPLDDFKGSLAPRSNFVAMTIPECLPERLEVFSYAVEFAYLHDDVTDTVDRKQSDAENDYMVQVCREGLQSEDVYSQSDGKKQMQTQIFRKMMTVDKDRAMVSIEAWENFVKTAAGRQRDDTFKTLEEYIPYRILDVGETFWFGMLTFGLGLTIPEHETESCRNLTRSAWVACGLTNDLFSWEKEYTAATEFGHKNIANAVWVLMKELSVDSNKARQICRQMIKDNVAKYLCIVQENRNNTTLSLDLRRYIEAMQYTLKGHAIWCQTCHRYNPNAKYNNFQLSLMEKGVAETIKWCSTSRLETPISPKTEQPGPNLSDRLNL